MSKYSVWVCTDHASHFVGGASVVVAESELHARGLLDKELIEHGLKPYADEPYTLKLLNTDDDMADGYAIVLRDGDY